MVSAGPLSIILGLLEAQMLVLAAAILWRHARSAERYLAALLIVLAGMLTPFAIGYAGAYDRWPWLSFAPFAVPLAMGPLLYAHLNALVLDRPISRWHGVLPLCQFAYQAAAFCLPLHIRSAFNRDIQRPWLDPLLAVLLLASMIGYALAGLRLLRRHREWLAARRADLAAANRVRAVLGAFAVILVARASYMAVDAFVTPLSYVDMFGFYAALAVIGSALAIEGWRRGDQRLQPITEPAQRDWRQVASDWLQQVEDGEWWRDPDLDLPGLARRLGTNTAYLSRALNEGLGLGFADAINGLRVEHVAARLREPTADNMVSLALDAGFGSKATFNRVFRQRFGMSPTAYRRGSNSKNVAARPDLQRSA
jgi:AraC-like DNA-binding protein